jgi:hypothetical protein
MNMGVLPSRTPRIFSPPIESPLPAHPRDDHHDPPGARKTLEAFSAKLRNDTHLDELSEDLVGVVRETMQPAHVSVVTFRDGSEGRAGRVAAGGLSTTHTRLSVYVPRFRKSRSSSGSSSSPPICCNAFLCTTAACSVVFNASRRRVSRNPGSMGQHYSGS